MCKVCELNNQTKDGWEGNRVIVNDKVSLGIFSEDIQQYPLLFTYVKEFNNGEERERYSEFIELSECPFCGIKFDDEYFKKYKDV